MTTVQEDFESRVSEIEAYFEFVERVDAGDTLLVASANGLPAYTAAARDDLLRTFRASAILLLYNLMESTVTNAVEAIFDELSTQGIQFNDCRSEVRRVVLTNLKQHNPGEILPELQRLSSDIITKTFKKDKVVSGNVDARRIKELSDEYGINHPAADGNDLLTVKTSRNDLAHGSKSFAEVGRTFTIADIIRIKDKVIAYLTAMLANVTAYIENQHYRTSAVHP
jgi:hypothetical protein